MKTTLTLLIAGLVILTTPILASAHGRQYRTQGDSYNSRFERNSSNSVRVHRVDRHPARHNKHRLHREKRQLKRELRETRRELHRVERRIRHQRQRPYYAVQPYYVRPPVIFGIPQLVFQFGW